MWSSPWRDVDVVEDVTRLPGKKGGRKTQDLKDFESKSRSRTDRRRAGLRFRISICAVVLLTGSLVGGAGSVHVPVLYLKVMLMCELSCAFTW